MVRLIVEIIIFYSVGFCLFVFRKQIAKTTAENQWRYFAFSLGKHTQKIFEIFYMIWAIIFIIIATITFIEVLRDY